MFGLFVLSQLTRISKLSKLVWRMRPFLLTGLNILLGPIVLLRLILLLKPVLLLGSTPQYGPNAAVNEANQGECGQKGEKRGR